MKARADGSWTADGHGNEVVVDAPQAFNWQSGGDARGLDLTDVPSALSTSQTPAVLLTSQAFDEMNFTTDGDTHHVLRAGTKQSTGVMVPQAFRKAARAQSSEDAESWVEDGQANTLNAFDVGDTRSTHAILEPEWSAEETGTIQARSYKGLNHENVRDGQAVVQQYGVRRLTPVECERLQSFPDGWTEPAGSDSARYKAMGNAVTVNVVRWILGRLP